MFEIHELKDRIQRQSDWRKTDDLKVSFDRLQANVMEVQADLVEHRRMEEEKRRERNERKVNGNLLNGDTPIRIRQTAEVKSEVLNNHNGL